MISFERLQHVLAALPSQRIALLGDLFLDRYLEIDPQLCETSIETGLEAYQVTRVRNSPGALGTVLNNLAALGVGRLVPVSLLGDDGQAYDLLQALHSLPVNPEFLLKSADRLTPTYTKPLVWRDGAWHELHRLDLRNRRAVSNADERRLLAALDAAFAQADGLIVCDQVNEEGVGVVTPAVRRQLAELGRTQPDKLIFVDSRRQIGQFRCATLKPNLHEARQALERVGRCLQAPAQVAAELAALTGCRVLLTDGPQGMHLAQPEGAAEHVPGVEVPGPFDPVGAGDSATAGCVAALLAGCTLSEAATVGNLVASLTVQQLGTTGTADPAHLRERWRFAFDGGRGAAPKHA